MAALEMQYRTFRFLQSARHQAQLSKLHDWFEFNTTLLRVAVPYAFTEESAASIVMASRTIPPDAQLSQSLLPFDFAWWWFLDGLAIRTYNINGDRLPVRALLVGRGHDFEETEGVFFSTFCSLESDVTDVTTPISRSFWRYGESLHSVIDRLQKDAVGEGLIGGQHVGDIEEVCRFFFAALSWLEQKILTVSSGHIERHRRKQLAREHQAPIPSDVKVITLRRAESSRAPHDASEPVDWSCRWVVNGHWRNQVYANDEHKLIYILPYVKGPDDKPLKIPTHTVYSVSR